VTRKIESSPAEPISVRIPEAVRLTGLSRSRIYELMRSGDIEFAKVGSSTLILVESLRSFVQGRRSRVDDGMRRDL
jgi:excisionase family DNA binding protein